MKRSPSLRCLVVGLLLLALPLPASAAQAAEHPRHLGRLWQAVLDLLPTIDLAKVRYVLSSIRRKGEPSPAIQNLGADMDPTG